MPLLEAVPNLSEGNNTAVLQNLAARLSAHRAVRLLHVDRNPSANRSVWTLLGEPSAVCAALFDFIAAATNQLDMRAQHGEHPRLGMVDVCPLVPVRDISLAQSAQWAVQLARQVGTQLHIPVYLYEAAARQPARQNLAFLRRGEYENLPEKLHTLPPDFGPSHWSDTVAKTGACVIGARPFLIAFNINLSTADVQTAKQIAAQIRQSSGGLTGVKAIGWYMENFKRAQVSCNITDFQAAPLHLVYETCRRYAAALGAQATGCELVGLVPLEALLQSGRYYAPHENSLRRLLQTAAEKLNLSDVKPFHLSEQVLEIKAGLTSLID